MNILDINYSDTYLKKVESDINVLFVIKKIISAINSVTKQLIKDIIFVGRNENFNDKVLCFATTVNQKETLSPLKSRINNILFVGLSKESENRIPMGIGCLTSIIITPFFIYEFLKFHKEREKLLFSFESYFFIRGMYYWWSLYFKVRTPKSIIMSNDHLVWHRVLRMAAQKNSIPVVYIQHASVTEKFPKLEFDLSLLEGKDALVKYKKKGIKGEVALVGMIKYDKYHKYVNNTKSVNTVGICTSLFDDEKIIYESVKKLHNNLKDVSIIIRPHPRDERIGLYKRLEKELGIKVSNSKLKNSFDFLKKVDLNIASESSIHLEAVLLNVYPVYFKLTNSIFDHYRYIENNLITEVSKSVKELVAIIDNVRYKRPNVRFRAKYYVDTVGTKFDGRSVELVAKEIGEFI